MFIQHRQAAIQKLGLDAAIIFAAPEYIRNNDCSHPYRQDSYFYYLTGFEEPESVLVLAPAMPEGQQVTLFLRRRDPTMEVWYGERLGVERAVETLGVDQAFAIDELEEKLPGLLKGAPKLYHTLGNTDRDKMILDAMASARRVRRSGAETPDDICSLATLLDEMRLFKSEAELDIMRRAAQVTATGFATAMEQSQPGMFEYELQAYLEFEWRRRGSRRNAFDTIMASGYHACVLHYEENNRRTEANDVVLCDAGCELEGYASDVTRTWPLSGKFTPAQHEIYQIVLDANKAAIAACKKGVAFNDVHMVALRILVAGLIKTGICEGTVDSVIESGAYQPYYMHRTSHWVGCDVHDVGRYCVNGVSRPLEPGMVLTIEPGLYIAPDANVPEQYKGIGVRIEDDVLVTDGEPEVITSMIPKEIADLEQIVGTKAHVA